MIVGIKQSNYGATPPRTPVLSLTYIYLITLHHALCTMTCSPWPHQSKRSFHFYIARGKGKEQGSERGEEKSRGGWIELWLHSQPPHDLSLLLSHSLYLSPYPSLSLSLSPLSPYVSHPSFPSLSLYSSIFLSIPLSAPAQVSFPLCHSIWGKLLWNCGLDSGTVRCTASCIINIMHRGVLHPASLHHYTSGSLHLDSK